MAHRDMMGIVEGIKDKIPHESNMLFPDLVDLLNMVNRGEVVEALKTAYQYGFAMGKQSEQACQLD